MIDNSFRRLRQVSLVQEAIWRMRKLSIPDEIISKFASSGVLSVFIPTLESYAEADEDVLKQALECESLYGVMVFFVIRSYTDAGVIDSLLIASPSANEIRSERAFLEKGATYAYIYDHANPGMSEISLIGIERVDGGVCRKFWVDGVYPSLLF